MTNCEIFLKLVSRSRLSWSEFRVYNVGAEAVPVYLKMGKLKGG